ncbi:uncharacterized protein LOC127265767 [Andrographis paniculata]|uniref:uncharacterized protein LOC127265767 n=1 Tax=Andrographis paniculata TaxID=175694 RepID=UPI0021E783CD|nr:uncharacterized protein LOC127265767 [Andrographis paniculata]
MAARHQEEEEEEGQEEVNPNEKHDEQYVEEVLSLYLGLSFTVFLGFLPQNAIPLVSSLQSRNKALTFKLTEALEQLQQLRWRRKEDSKANARVAEIFASHRHSWQQEEKRLLQQIDEGAQEISYLKGKVEDFERLEGELRANVADLKREISERDEMINFMSSYGNGTAGLRMRSYGNTGLMMDELRVEDGPDVSASGTVFDPDDFLNSASASASNLWSAKAQSWQDLPSQQHHESISHLKHFVSRRESPWQDDGVSNGVLSKLTKLEQELLNLERFGDSEELSEVQLQMHKQAKRYQGLAGKIGNLCDRMKVSDSNEATVSSEFQMQRQTEFLLEAFRLQQRASEVNDKMMALQAEAKPGTKRLLDSARNNLKEIQRSLEIWLARIIGDLEGSLAKDGASRARDQYYVSSRFPFVQS